MTSNPPGGAPANALTADGLLHRNVLLNLAGWTVPAAAALIALPLLAGGLGAARFGLVVLAWSAIGLFSLFDFGLGRALTRMVAERSARGTMGEVPDLVWTSAWIVIGLSAMLTAAGVLAAPFIAVHLLKVPVELRGDATGVVRWLAVGIIPMAHGVVLRGVLEAVQRFGTVNRLRVPLGVATYLGPLLALPLGGGATMAVAIIVLARTLYWLAHLPALERVHPGLASPRPFSPDAARKLFRTGGWITVSNVVSPVMVQADRLIVAASLPIAASGWYGTASEVATKQWLFTAAVQPVLFAALSATLAHDRERAAALMDRATRITLFVLFPVALVLVLFAVPGLHLWMRGAYRPETAGALRWLAIAIFLNAAAQVPYAALQGGVDARSPALLHLIELPLYAALLLVLVREYGVTGAAIAFCARMSFDAVAMWMVAARKMPEVRPAARDAAMLGTLMVSVLAAAAWWAARLG